MKPKNKTIIASIFFLLVSIIDVYGVITNKRELVLIFKPLVVTSLAILYLVSVKKANFWYVSALFFCFWGDVLLMFGDEFFVLGLVSFLIGHILYIKIVSGFLKKQSLQKIVISAVPFILFFSGIVFLINDNLGTMFLPVIVYGVVISVFGTVCLLNYLQEKTTANLWLLLGAIIFIASDSMIALNKFYQSNQLFSMSIIITYIVAQYLICKAIIVKYSI